MDLPRGEYSFPRSSRLTRTQEYQKIYKSGRRVRSASFLLVVRPAAGPVTRIGLSSGHKVGGAVVRNRVKRRMREIVRLHRRSLTQTVDMVLVAHPQAASLSFSQMEREITFLVMKAGLLADAGRRS